MGNVARADCHRVERPRNPPLLEAFGARGNKGPRKPEPRRRFDARNVEGSWRRLHSRRIASLALPGFENVKNLRNGAAPSPCTLVECWPNRRYPLSAFDRWKHAPKEGEGTWDAHSPAISSISGTTPLHRIRGLVSHLDRNVDDRSRRDFAIICELIRAGLTPREIWQLVEGKSKFRTNGAPYFEHTLEAALNAVSKRTSRER